MTLLCLFVVFVFTATSPVSSLEVQAVETFQKPSIPHISGRAVEWLNDLGKDLYVKIKLNDQDPSVIQDNKGKNQPVMLSDVNQIGIDGKVIGSLPHAVLLESGSHIAFQIKVNEPGPCGFGFKIVNGVEPIVNSLYCVDIKGSNTPLTTNVVRYQNNKKTIQVDNFETLGIINKDEKCNYMTCQIESWTVDGFKIGEITYPVPRYESAKVSAGVKGGAVHQGRESTADFGTISNIKENKEAIRSMTVKVFVFANAEEKEKYYKSYKDILVDEF